MFIDFDFYLLITPGCWKGGRSKSWKLGAYTPGQYKPSEDFKPGFKEKEIF